MKTNQNTALEIPDYSRRGMLQLTGTGVLSASALLLLGGCESIAGSQQANNASIQDDINILNVALTLEHEAINAYQLGAMSGLLEKGVLDVAVLFQGHHKSH